MTQHHKEPEKNYILWAKVISGECHNLLTININLLVIEVLGKTTKLNTFPSSSPALCAGTFLHSFLNISVFSTCVSSLFSSHVPFQCPPVFSLTFLLPCLLMCARSYTFLPLSPVPSNYRFFLYTFQQRHHRLLSLV